MRILNHEAVTREQVNKILGIKENYELPEKLMADMLDDARRTEVFEKFLGIEPDTSKDFLRDYFQAEHGDRDALKQDYTPDAICEIVSGIISQDNPKSIADICAGSGALTISAVKGNNTTIYCEELSNRVLAVLIFNLAIRNISAVINNGDSLKMEFSEAYRIIPGERFAKVEKIEPTEPAKCEAVITNPPYSLKWEPLEDERFLMGVAPKSKADYAFILHALHRLEDNGIMVAVLPHGVLFRGQSEGGIRENLLKGNYIDAVIGLPDNLFMNTGIPVCLLVLRKNRRSKDILFIDASKEFVKSNPQNIMTEEQVQKVINTYHGRNEVEKYSHIVYLGEIEENGYNLNIPRYVDTFEREPVPGLVETLKELAEIDEEIHKTEVELFSMLKDIVGTTPEEDKEQKKAIKLWGDMLEAKYKGNKEKQISWEI